MSQPKQSEYVYSYADYRRWPENERWELLDGTPHMQASPNLSHQGVQIELASQIHIFLRDKPCRAFSAPVDVLLADKDEDESDITTVLVPDIIVVCDQEKINRKGIFGAPDLVVEIASRSTAKYDMYYKFNKYQQAGVREYWVVEPDNQFIQVFVLQENGQFGPVAIYADEDLLTCTAIPDLTIDLPSVFRYSMPDEEALQEQKQIEEDKKKLQL